MFIVATMATDCTGSSLYLPTMPYYCRCCHGNSSCKKFTIPSHNPPPLSLFLPWQQPLTVVIGMVTVLVIISLHLPISYLTMMPYYYHYCCHGNRSFKKLPIPSNNTTPLLLLLPCQKITQEVPISSHNASLLSLLLPWK